MNTPRIQFEINRSVLALALLAACGSAYAEDDEVTQLTQPASLVSAGLAGASGESRDRAIYGQYNGRRLDSSYLLLDIDYVKRDEEMGLWTNFSGTNLGLDTQEMSFSQSKQGDWKYLLEYNEMVRRDPRSINSGLVFAGTATPTVTSLATAGAGREIDLDLRRKAVSLSAEKWLTASLLFETSVKNEDKSGTRLSGIGFTCGLTSPVCASPTGAILLLPEPVNSTIKQFEARLNYTGEKFMLSGGYYGSFFNNASGIMNPALSGSLYNPDGTVLNIGTTPGSTLAGFLQQSVALPPDNQAQQLYVSGNYAFTNTTRATFKFSYTHATQNVDFGGAGLFGAPAGISSLEGVLDSSLAQLGITSQPMAKLSVLANLRYEDKDDKTPLALYNGTSTNNQNSSKKLNAKAEASYRLPDNYRATLGVDYATVHRDLPVSTAVQPTLFGVRENTAELGYRAELRRSMSEILNAAVSYIQSWRDGGSWINAGAFSAASTYPMTMADRVRNKVRVSADWAATEKLSLQFMLDAGKDTYTSPTDKGLRDSGMSAYGIDAVYAISENWKLTGYVNQATQTLHIDHYNYLNELENVNTILGLGVVGKPSGKLDIGAELTMMDDNNRYQQNLSGGGAIVGGGLPDVTYRMASLKLFGKYALQKNASIRVDLVQQSVEFKEWTWGSNGIPFTYSDNSSVSMLQNQNVTFLGASYVYKFR